MHSRPVLYILCLDTGGVHVQYQRGFKNVIRKGMELNAKGESCELMMDTRFACCTRIHRLLKLDSWGCVCVCVCVCVFSGGGGGGAAGTVDGRWMCSELRQRMAECSNQGFAS